MENTRKGFTLMELLVVVLIMGILAGMSMPYYFKTVETSKATDSLALGHMLGNAYRMFQVDNPGVTLSGPITNTCNTAVCSMLSATSACRLVACSYVAPQDWNSSSYSFNIGGSCGGGLAACVDRINTGSQYDNWGYNFNMSGGCAALNGAPTCPKF